MTYKERQKENEDKITNAFGYVPNTSGIYILTREENGFKFGYVGQAKHLRKRLGEHLSGHQHIDLSIKSHGFYSLTNPCGYDLKLLLCEEKDLDQNEQYYIKVYANAGYQLRNKKAGGQCKGSFNINEAREPKGYRDGIKQGEKIVIRALNKFFDKYLTYSVKEPTNKIKERKLKEFENLLGKGL